MILLRQDFSMKVFTDSEKCSQSGPSGVKQTEEALAFRKARRERDATLRYLQEARAAAKASVSWRNKGSIHSQGSHIPYIPWISIMVS